MRLSEVGIGWTDVLDRLPLCIEKAASLFEKVVAETKQQQRDESGFHALFLMALFHNSLFTKPGENCHGRQF